jgi:dTDP-4-amino-4,6-dideoxygalactose transaminase
MYRIGQEEVDAVARVVQSKILFRRGNPANGHQQAVVNFERDLAEKLGVSYALCLSGGGSAALTCALVGLGIGPGDEVIIPAYTYVATAAAVLSVGAVPVIVDVDETLTLDPQAVEKALSPHVKAIIPVHMVGRLANLEALLKVARDNGIKLIEDSCQCDGGSYKGRRAGSWGDAGALSFNDFKIISCGEGGALVTSDKNIFERALAYHDSLVSFPHFGEDLSIPAFLGSQMRASEIQGAILGEQLKRLDGILADLRRVRRLFESELGDVLQVAPNNDFEGDCGVVVAFQFEDAAKANAFATEAGGWLPINTGRHVYSNWDMLLENRVGHHPDMNPLNHPKNQHLRIRYSADACPRSLELLGRTVFISINPDWTEEQITQRIEQCRTAAQS